MDNFTTMELIQILRAIQSVREGVGTTDMTISSEDISKLDAPIR